MTLRTGVALAAMVVALAGLAPLAVAAPPPPNVDKAVLQEANCVYDSLSDGDVVLMVDTYLNADAAKKPDVEKTLALAQKTCGDKYHWSLDKHELAGEIALQGAVIDILLQDMVDAGLKDDGIVVGVWQKMPDDQLTPLFKDGWSNDQALVGRMKKLLVDAGVPDKPDMLANGVIVLAAATRESAAMDRWIHGAKP